MRVRFNDVELWNGRSNYLRARRLSFFLFILTFSFHKPALIPAHWQKITRVPPHCTNELEYNGVEGCSDYGCSRFRALRGAYDGRRYTRPPAAIKRDLP